MELLALMAFMPFAGLGIGYVLGFILGVLLFPFYIPFVHAKCKREHEEYEATRNKNIRPEIAHMKIDWELKVIHSYDKDNNLISTNKLFGY